MIFDLTTYRIRRKLLKVFGASFHVYDEHGSVVGFSSQKAFKLKEDIRVFTDETRGEELLSIQARQIVDFSACYDVIDSREGVKVGAARRKGFRSIIRDSWELLDADDRPIAQLTEDSTFKALLRRYLSNLIPQKFVLRGKGGKTSEQATFRVAFNPIVYNLHVQVSPRCEIDRRLVFATSVLIAAIEGRQTS